MPAAEEACGAPLARAASLGSEMRDSGLSRSQGSGVPGLPRAHDTAVKEAPGADGWSMLTAALLGFSGLDWNRNRMCTCCSDTALSRMWPMDCGANGLMMP